MFEAYRKWGFTGSLLIQLDLVAVSKIKVLKSF